MQLTYANCNFGGYYSIWKNIWQDILAMYYNMVYNADTIEILNNKEF